MRPGKQRELRIENARPNIRGQALADGRRLPLRGVEAHIRLGEGDLRDQRGPSPPFPPFSAAL